MPRSKSLGSSGNKKETDPYKVRSRAKSDPGEDVTFDLDCTPPPSYEAGPQQRYEPSAPWHVKPVIKTADAESIKPKTPPPKSQQQKQKTPPPAVVAHPPPSADAVSAATGLTRGHPKSPPLFYPIIRNRDTNPDEDFTFVKCIGKGAYGEVKKVTDKRKPGEQFALKTITDVTRGWRNTYAEREVRLTESLKHENIVRLIEAYRWNDNKVHMVLEYCDMDLTLYQGVVLARLKGERKIGEVKHIALGILNGVEYMHGEGVVHRDMKTGNILMKSKGGIKICDFGLARKIDVDDKPTDGRKRHYTGQLCTRTTRAPELLVGATDYGCESDIWSVMWIIAHMFVSRPSKVTDSDIAQINLIQSICGDFQPNHPNPQELINIGMTRGNPRVVRKYFLPFVEKDNDALALLDEGFVINPKNRPKASKLIDHTFFNNESPDPIPSMDNPFQK